MAIHCWMPDGLAGGLDGGHRLGSLQANGEGNDGQASGQGGHGRQSCLGVVQQGVASVHQVGEERVEVAQRACSAIAHVKRSSIRLSTNCDNEVCQGRNALVVSAELLNHELCQ